MVDEIRVGDNRKERGIFGFGSDDDSLLFFFLLLVLLFNDGSWFKKR